MAARDDGRRQHLPSDARFASTADGFAVALPMASPMALWRNVIDR
ncbi:hypothetical protein [Mycobacterium sp.]|nr:hypothetical protein [Mycobacterium sp.]